MPSSPLMRARTTWLRACLVLAALLALPATHAQEPPAPPERPAVHIALLLPTRSESLASAANAIRDGVMAAMERDGDGIDLQLVETDDNVNDILATYQSLTADYDLIIGPLARSAVSALVRGDIKKPTLVLSQPDSTVLPPNVLAVGLSIEDEARQLAAWASLDKPNGKLLIVSTNVAWQKRAAKAFATLWPKADAPSVEIAASNGYLSAGGMRQLKTRIALDKPNLIFLALDAEQTRQVRPLLPPEASIYASSQLNSYKNADGSEPHAWLDGIRAVDLPWQLQQDHPAVMIYPHPGDEQPGSNADIERLYALGIDAFRIARELALAHQSRFKLDGVTGKLSVQLIKGVAHFERQAVPGIFRGGILQPLQGPTPEVLPTPVVPTLPALPAKPPPEPAPEPPQPPPAAPGNPDVRPPAS